ncbi:hypothetical protein EHQ12_13480 [Leptospira gomenensis]|uniref:STAS domain-containing protein n=1 Tax=Leptospira gomenensis TaxID=2484974 RepID=A0A5F1YPY7_9LEPT|nr:hypothetical protein [Leptospira gomenensis]TGK28072.1 hypothetical protein EHQ17_18485 [Leptospira gomenensis]TGK37072.1 hypothetical protein EHQ12_13480 [Leptospira gomenensis]TGK45708.1 hypothetical protein EHQ07_08490 [Leptospira gomenensis]TGK59647.1 hypothetical protein EHQ13_12700 [Leptospira gomenensis]
MEISKEDYSVEMEKNRGRINVSGTLRLLNVEEYEPIITLIETALENSGRGKAVIDIRNLDHLNSAGIASFSRFVAGYDKKNFGNVEFKGNKDRYWQIKFLDNLKKLRPEIKTTLE